MLTLFKALDLIGEREGLYYLTELSKEYLIDASPWSLGPYFSSLKERPICGDMLRVLKTGKPANWGAKKDEKEWAVAMEEDEFPEGFDVHLFSHVLHDWDFSDVKLPCRQVGLANPQIV